MKAITRDEFAELLKGAGIKARIVRELRFVPEEIEDWKERDFIAIMNRSRTEGVIVASLENQYVVPFRLKARQPNAQGRMAAIICDICATWQTGPRSAIITFPRERSSVSFLCCGDLDCSLHVRDKTAQAAVSRSQLRETNSVEDRVARLRQRLYAMLEN